MTNKEDDQLPKPRKKSDQVPKPFDPTIPDDDVKLPADSTRGKSRLTVYLANEEVIRKSANDIFGKEFSEDQRQSIIEESINIRDSKQRVVLEHMRIGAAVATILKTTVRTLVDHYGPSDRVMKMANDMTYAFLQITQGYGRNACNIYLRQYETFCDNDEAITHLSATDMRALTVHKQSEEIIEAVIDLRKNNPKARQREVSQLIADLEEAEKLAAKLEAQNHEKDLRIAALSDRADEAMTEAQDAKDHGKRAQRLLDALRGEMEVMRESRDAFAQATRDQSTLYNELVRERAKLQAEMDDLAERFKNLQENPETVEKIVVQPPEALSDMTVAMTSLMKKMETITASVESKKKECERLDEQLAAANREIDAASEVREHLTRMVAKFSAFAAEFNVAQLLTTIEGNVKSHKAILLGFSDILGKYLEDIHLAIKKAA